MTKGEIRTVIEAILGEPDQEKLAHWMAKRYPEMPRDYMLEILQECERYLRQMGFKETLDLLRRELVVSHPSWSKR